MLEEVFESRYHTSPSFYPYFITFISGMRKHLKLPEASIQFIDLPHRNTMQMFPVKLATIYRNFIKYDIPKKDNHLITSEQIFC